MESKKQIDEWVEEILSKMTLSEKVSLLAGQDRWSTVPVERLGVTSLGMTDGPHGVRYCRTSGVHKATSFPTGVSMGSSWNPELVKRVGEALAEETAALNCDILLGPCVNIVRCPLGGRNFESYSEDPYLAGCIGTAYVNGVQSKNIGTSLKHYACNNQENGRFRCSSEVDERTLREIYLPAFEAIVKNAQPWTVMCSYNRINGIYASEHKRLLTDILREEWGFEGIVISDWSANHTIVKSVAAGLDIEMPGPAKYYGRLLEEAVNMWQIEEKVIDATAGRILRIIARSGKRDKNFKRRGKINTAFHQKLARKLAEESIVLLKNNNGLLPLNQNKIESVAVIGLNALEARIGGGGSSYLNPPYRVSPLQGITELLKDNVQQIKYETGCDNFEEFPEIPCDYFIHPESDKSGVLVEYFESLDCSGNVFKSVEYSGLNEFFFNISEYNKYSEFSLRLRARFIAPVSGRYGLKLKYQGECRLFVDGKLLLEVKHDRFLTRFDDPDISEPVFIEIAEGNNYCVVVEYVRRKNERAWLQLLGAYSPNITVSKRIDNSAKIAAESDVAVVFAGMAKGFESEGKDRLHMNLPGFQNELIKAVVSANPNTVVVLNTGSPITMPWINEVSAVIEAYYPGMEGGRAIADILFGHVNPSGKLTVSFPKRYEDNPAFLNYPGTRKVHYGEGIFVGYRYYDTKGVEPLFPFGHGLSYTCFKYSNISITKNARDMNYTVNVDIKNTGVCTGKEVVQLYIKDIESSLMRPLKELKGFRKIRLSPDEKKRISFTLNERSFSFYNPKQKQWIVEPGEFEILIGSSSRDIHLNSKIVIGGNDTTRVKIGKQVKISEDLNKSTSNITGRIK